jgi:activator of 2-hydroxyglutaryl-CoA dehydratase
MVEVLGNVSVQVSVTGSAGMGIAEQSRLPFVQEVIASANIVRLLYPEARTLLDVGGEDTKIIFFDEHFRPDIRMNGACAGGTGAFIDQMAGLLHMGIDELNDLAGQSRRLHRLHPAAECSRKRMCKT